MTSPACEHVLVLDGIAIVVHKGNLVPSLSRKQLQAIFSGQLSGRFLSCIFVALTDGSYLSKLPR